MIRIHQVKTEDSKQIEKQILKKLHMPKSDLISWTVHKKSIDARKKQAVISWTVDAEVRHEKKYLRHRDVSLTPDETFRFTPEGDSPLENRPVVVGFGPAGIFAALLLAEYGYAPLVIERGAEIDERTTDVSRFWKEGILNPESNVQFGMGGAGAFSDGKLTTRSKDLRSRKVYEELVSFGASPDILIEKHPHIGTDGFVPVLKNALHKIRELGGEVLFHTCLQDIQVHKDRLVSITVSTPDVQNPADRIQKTIPCQALIAAAGHSAEDTIRMLHNRGVQMSPKNFAVGVRIEHLQDFINEAMLKESKNDPALTPARYQLSYTADNGKGVYTFCMCPGGYVIPSSSVPETVVVNGMSYAARAGENANAALLVQTVPETLWQGVEMQEDLERRAYQISDSYKAPVQLASDFIEGKVSRSFGTVTPTYELGTVFADFNDIFDMATAEALKEALLHFEKQVPGYLQDALLTGVETRSSSAVRIDRDRKTLQSSIFGLYPCGEGSGYAGGIMTSAIDGIKCACALMNTFQKPADMEKY